MAAKSAAAARRAPLLAAIAALLLPLLIVLPGLLAVALPAPHSTTIVRNENGVIYHEINVVPKAASAGLGLVPAKSNPVTGVILLDASGRPQLDYDMALPNLLLHYLPNGLLGLGVAALLACFMGGIAANLTAFNAVFTGDLYRAHIRPDAPDAHYIAAARWATVGFVLLAAAASVAVFHFDGILDALLLVFAIVNAPLFAVLLLGVFWKRATGHGAFAGLLAGSAAALLHHGLTLPVAAQPGLRGGWITVLHRYPGVMAQDFATILAAFCVSLIVTITVSLGTRPRPASELAGLVLAHGQAAPWRQHARLAAAVLLSALALTIFFY
jgi:SSS family solute:Na+ symporter